MLILSVIMTAHHLKHFREYGFVRSGTNGISFQIDIKAIKTVFLHQSNNFSPQTLTIALLECNVRFRTSQGN
ncbi:hypothetical protein WT08_00195 [Burkholderia sp. MSMB1552]|nr:hypothetical protein WT08_00195 [Burkholderia sp. MSMB1552]KWZ50471.1 hypothetical protein WS92_24065 [Burkholderia sp. MSMB1588]